MKKKANLFAAISHIHEAMHQLKMIGALDPSYPRDGDEKVLDVALHSLLAASDGLTDLRERLNAWE